MTDSPDITAIGSAIVEPARSKMLGALMDGRARTATELALEADVTPSTASSHLVKLRQAGLISLAAQGRHRYFRLATAEIAALLEQLMGMAAEKGAVRFRPRDEGLRRARVCYDHLAGEAGVELLQRMRGRRLLRGGDDLLELTAEGESWLGNFGIDVADLRGKKRPLLRSCLDWSERRVHLAGAVGAAILTRLLELHFAKRDSLGRAVAISPRGEAFLKEL